MSRVPYAMEEFDNQKSENWEKNEIIADRIARRHKIGARWDKFDEIEFFEIVEDGEDVGFNSE